MLQNMQTNLISCCKVNKRFLIWGGGGGDKGLFRRGECSFPTLNVAMVCNMDGIKQENEIYMSITIDCSS